MPDSQRTSGMMHDALEPQIGMPINCRYTRRYGAIGVVPQSSDIRVQTKKHESDADGLEVGTSPSQENQPTGTRAAYTWNARQRMASRRAGWSNAISAWDTAQPEMASSSTPFSLGLDSWASIEWKGDTQPHTRRVRISKQYKSQQLLSAASERVFST
jgi:hypothetical protein